MLSVILIAMSVGYVLITVSSLIWYWQINSTVFARCLIWPLILGKAIVVEIKNVCSKGNDK